MFSLLNRLRLKVVAGMLGVLLAPMSAMAATTGTMGTLDNTILMVREDLTGFWAYTLIVVAFVIGGISFALGGDREIVKKIGMIVMGGALALGATSLIPAVFSTSSALVG